MFKKTIDKILFLSVIAILVLFLFGIVNGLLNIKNETKIQDSEQYWVDNDLAIVGFNSNNETFEVILKNNLNSTVKISRFSVGDSINNNIISLIPGNSFIYDFNLTCEPGKLFDFPVIIEYSYNQEKIYFESEKNFRGMC